VCSSAISTLQRGYPTVLRCDNGPELACDAMGDWATGRVGLAFIPSHQPWRNGYIESFNGRLEHLRGSALGFRNLTNYIARSLLESGGFRPRLHPHL